MAKSDKSTNAGIGLTGLVFIVFLVMKLTKIGVVATWSWWWVTAPLWGVPALLIVAFLVIALIAGIKFIFS